MVFGMLAFVIQLAVLGGIVAVVVVALNRRRTGASVNVDAPRDVFTYLLLTVSLYVSAAGAMSIISGLADYWFPGAEYLGDPWTESARIGISMAVVAFPIFLYLNKVSHARIRSGDTLPDSRLRQAFIYLSLFVASVVILIDLMVLIYDLLSGDLTARFLMKALGLLVLAGLVIRYFQLELAVEPPAAAPGGPLEPAPAGRAPEAPLEASPGTSQDPLEPAPAGPQDPLEPSPRGPEGAA